MSGHSSLYYNTELVSLQVPAVYRTPTQSTGLDTQNFDDTVIAFNIGAPGDTLSGSTKICMEVQESPDNVNWTACADSALTNVTDTGAANTGTVAVLTANGQGSQSYLTGYIGFQRYVRGVLNYIGTHTNGTAADVYGLATSPRQAKVNP